MNRTSTALGAKACAPFTALPSDLIPYVRQAIRHIEQRQPYSEYGWVGSVPLEPKASTS